LIKATIPDQLLDEWFTKSLLPPIARDVTMGGFVTEEEAIARAQYLDLVYSQYGTLYELIPNAPCTSIDPSKPSSTAHADGIIGVVKTQSPSPSVGPTNCIVLAPTTSSTSLSSTSPLTQAYEVNVVQFATPQQSRERKKTKNKPKKNNNHNENPKTPTHPPALEKQAHRKPKFWCLIYGDDHYTRDCPHRDEVAKNFKGNSQPVVLTRPFPQQ
jgi:hypothetical protein